MTLKSALSLTLIAFALSACGTTYNHVTERTEYRPECEMSVEAKQRTICGGAPVRDLQLHIFSHDIHPRAGK